MKLLERERFIGVRCPHVGNTFKLGYSTASLLPEPSRICYVLSHQNFSRLQSLLSHLRFLRVRSKDSRMWQLPLVFVLLFTARTIRVKYCISPLGAPSQQDFAVKHYSANFIGLTFNKNTYIPEKNTFFKLYSCEAIPVVWKHECQLFPLQTTA